jgi:hypothetical protein
MKCCQKCGSSENIEEHHVHPAFMNDGIRSGQTIDLCKKCHHLIHQMIIPSILFRNIHNKDDVIAEIKNATVKWIEKETKKVDADNIDDDTFWYCSRCNWKNINDWRNCDACHSSRYICRWCDIELDCEDKICPYCYRLISEDYGYRLRGEDYE